MVHESVSVYKSKKKRRIFLKEKYWPRALIKVTPPPKRTCAADVRVKPDMMRRIPISPCIVFLPLPHYSGRRKEKVNLFYFSSSLYQWLPLSQWLQWPTVCVPMLPLCPKRQGGHLLATVATVPPREQPIRPNHGSLFESLHRKL